MAEAQNKVEVPAGLFAFTSYGVITAETFQTVLDMQRHCYQQGLHNVSFTTIQGNLVDKARNEAAKVMLGNPNFKYLLFLDGDMLPAPDFVAAMLTTAYGLCPWADAIGAWCPLRGKPFLPTIDTGTGTWESTAAGIGPIEVIRTGSAAILVKRHVFERMEFPWYGVRPAPRAIDVLAEVDNYARCKMDGKNPLREHAAWDVLERCARQDAHDLRARGQVGLVNTLSSVGEDSAFADRMKANGFRIVVNTNIVVQHLERHAITPDDHYKAMKESERMVRLAAGVA